MVEINQKQQKILALFLQNGAMRSSEVHFGLGTEMALVTIKRTLAELVEIGVLHSIGSGRSTGYEITTTGRVFAHTDAGIYCVVEPDKRYGFDRYNFDLLPQFPTELFSEAEQVALESATAEYRQRTEDIPPAIQKKELERLIIELSWKSSKIEGNTYTLLDTEKLILENKEAVGHDKNEARMILNHKDAFLFVHDNASQFKTPTRANLESLHKILVKDMNINTGLRKRLVGVTGSKYRPLENKYQIAEAVEALSSTIARVATPYAKALVALLGISYIQPFEDGNKRTSRLMANAILIAHSRAPLSYRSVDENEYREAMLVFYELNSIVPFKKIFIDQYLFAAKNYAVK